jgi:hypothetical protein
LKAVGDDCQAAVEFEACHPPGIMFAGKQTTLKVTGETVGPVGRFEEYGHALSRLVF